MTSDPLLATVTSYANRSAGRVNNQFLYRDFPPGFSLPKLAQSALHFTYYLLQPCYIHHLLNSLWSIHSIPFKVPWVIQDRFPSLSIARYSFTAKWTDAPLSSPVARATVFDEPTGLRMTRTHDHSAIATRQAQQQPLLVVFCFPRLGNRSTLTQCLYFRPGSTLALIHVILPV